MRLWSPLLVVPLLASCSFLPRKAATPLPVDTAPAAKPPARETLVMLPGRFEKPRAFREEGVFELVAKHRPKARVAATDLHLGYYRDRSAVDRLRDDVIRPAQARGEKIVLAGISLGGLGSLLYALEQPGEVEEILLFAPYLGDPEILDEIKAAGGLRKWQPGEIGEDDFQRKLWSEMRSQWLLRGKPPSIRLAIGKEDRHVDGSRLLRDELMDADDYLEVEGGHDWETWRTCFERILPPARNR